MTDEVGTTIGSPRLRRLQAELAGDPGGRDEILAAFWAEMTEAGTPLVEIEEDEAATGLVTWLYREGGERPARVAVQEYASYKPEDERDLARLDGTDAWHLTWTARTDLRATYAFRVWTDADGEPEVVADPLNQHRQQGDWEGDGIESVLVMPGATPLPWLGERPGVPRGTLHAHTFRSEILGNERPVWVHTPAGFDPGRAEPYPFVVIFDGEAHHSGPGVLDNLVAAGEIPPVVAILVNQIGIRGEELTCNPAFSRMIASELVPWAREMYRLTSDPALAALNGRSYGGLCSAYTALQHPDVFGNAFLQSASCWMHPSVVAAFNRGTGQVAQGPVGEGAEVPTIIAAYQAAERAPIRIFQEVGTVENGPPPARITQTFANRWFHDLLVLKGYETHYREFVGGHDDAWWRGTFADGMVWVFGGESKQKTGNRK